MILSGHNDGKVIKYEKEKKEDLSDKKNVKYEYKPDIFVESESNIRKIKASGYTDHVVIRGEFDGKE